MIRMVILLMVLLIAGRAHSSTLIVTQSHGYQMPADADVVKVLRTGGSVWTPLAEVLPTERIQVCVDDPAVAIGSTTVCATRIPGRTDNWQLRSLAIPPPPAAGTVTFAWDAVTQFDDGKPIVGLAGYTVTVRHQDCDLSAGMPPCEVATWEPPVEVGTVTQYLVANVKNEASIIVQGRLADGTLGLVSELATGKPQVTRPKPGKVTNVHVVTP